MSKKPTKTYLQYAKLRLQYAELVKTYNEFAVAYHKAGVKTRERFDLLERVNILTTVKRKPSK